MKHPVRILMPNLTEVRFDDVPQVFDVAEAEVTNVSHCAGSLFKMITSLKRLLRKCKALPRNATLCNTG